MLCPPLSLPWLLEVFKDSDNTLVPVMASVFPHCHCGRTASTVECNRFLTFEHLRESHLLTFLKLGVAIWFDLVDLWADWQLSCAHILLSFPRPWQFWKHVLIMEVQWWSTMWMTSAMETHDGERNFCSLLATKILGPVGYCNVSWRIQPLLGHHPTSSPVSTSYWGKYSSCSLFHPRSLVTGPPDIW